MDPLSAEAQVILRHYKVTYDEAIFYQSHHQTGKYLLLAGITVMLWDHITTLPDEVRYVWQMKRRWTIAAALFSFNRYVSPLGFVIRFIQLLLQTPTRPMCGVGQLTAYWNIISFACVEFVLMLRVWIMYGKGKKLGLFLGLVSAIALATSLIVLSKQSPTVIGLIPPYPTSLTFCRGVRSSPSAYFWLLIIASSVEVILLSLFCMKVYLARRDSMTTPLLSVLLTQGVAYYVVVLCAFAISIPATMHKELYIPLTDQNIVILIPCIACSRLILSLRGLYYSRMNVGSTTSGMLTTEEHWHTLLVSMPRASAATSLDTPKLAAHAEEGGDRICGQSEGLGIGLENLSHGRGDLTGPKAPIAEKRAAV